MKILMVCLGNICRSPIAEGVLQSKLGSDFIVDSAGTGDWHVGQKPDERAIAVSKKYGINISNLRARQIQTQDFDEFDLIFVMNQANYADVLSLAKTKEHREKVQMILKNEQNVPDPYFGDDEGFEEVFKLLDEVTDEVVNQLKSK